MSTVFYTMSSILNTIEYITYHISYTILKSLLCFLGPPLPRALVADDMEAQFGVENSGTGL